MMSTHTLLLRDSLHPEPMTGQSFQVLFPWEVVLGPQRLDVGRTVVIGLFKTSVVLSAPK